MSDLILSKLAEHPGAIAAELDASNADLTRLEGLNMVKRVGKRSTGKRGRPPIEWALIDAALPAAAPIQAAAPALPDIEDIRPLLSSEHQRQVSYIESTMKQPREDGDYRILAERYREIANQTRRRVGR
jgi:hypothetical protein